MILPCDSEALSETSCFCLLCSAALISEYIPFPSDARDPANESRSTSDDANKSSGDADDDTNEDQHDAILQVIARMRPVSRRLSSDSLWSTSYSQETYG